MNEWLIAQSRGRLRASPADELHALEAARARAEDRGDVEQLEAVDRELDRLFEDARQQAAEEHRAAAASARFSSGVRRPIRRELPPAQQMDQTLLRVTGRLR